jgi:Rhodopirellula transposase DDE domain
LIELAAWGMMISRRPNRSRIYWRGEPLRDYETIVKLIAGTTTAKVLTVVCRLDRRKYPTARKVTADEMKQLNLHPDKFDGEWNYVIKPHRTRLPQ